MKASLQQRLQSLVERHEELMRLLGEADVIHNQNKFRDYSREYAELEPLVKTYNEFAAAEAAIVNAENLLKDEDPEMREMAAEEIIQAKQQKEQTEDQLKILLLPKDPNDNSNIFLEIRAGAGGDEASIFAGDLFRAYHRYAEKQGWQVEIISSHSGEHGGFKEIIARIIGTGVYSHLKFESGAHRVQRVPDTEASGRIHTSTCTVAIMPEVADIEEFIINPNDLRVDTFRASGAGGQHVNRTDSAIRITHIPTGVVVECQDERSQHKNRAKAMSVLQAKLLDAERRKQQQEQAATRKSLVGTGDRSERIRTYNYPQGRVTDHRINLTLYKIDTIMEGDLGQVVDPLIREYQAELLAEFDS